MARTHAAPPAALSIRLPSDRLVCEFCSGPLHERYTTERKVIHLDHVVHYRVPVRGCINPECSRFRVPVHPEAELHVSLPQMETGLDLVAEVGAIRYRERRTVPE